MGTEENKEIGKRLTRIRGQATQADFAPKIGLHKNTLGTYERGEREIAAEPLARLVELGWNVNWLLTNEGPERLDQVAGHRVGEERGSYASQPMQQETINIAFQLIDDVVAELERQSKPPLSPEKRALMFTAMSGMLSEGMPQAKVLHFARAAAA